jgi:hypothetical protein
MTKITTNTQQTQLLQDALSNIPGAAKRAGAGALNSTGSSVRIESSRWIGQKYAIPVRDVQALLQVNRAKVSQDHLVAEVVDKPGKPVPMLKFVRGSKVAPSTRRTKDGGYTPAVGVPVLIKRKSGTTPLPGAFVAQMKSGHVGAFRRIEGSKKISELFLSAPTHILKSEEYATKAEQHIDRILPEALAAQVDKELSK